MSGPVTTADVAPAPTAPAGDTSTVEITTSRDSQVGRLRVRRALPQRTRRSVGAWCFIDHMGPADIGERSGLGVAPHPHIGLHTVTWLLAGEALHRDSLGTEQVVRPGQLNLMTAGHGVAHSEEGTSYRGTLHGLQLWVAQPSTTRDGEPAFEHHPELPQGEFGATTATVLIGDLDGTTSPARRDSELVGVDLELRDRGATIPVRSAWEYALVVLAGKVAVDDQHIEPGQLAYLGVGRDEWRFDTHEAARALLVGGKPFDEQLLMWWNFVARTRDEIDAAYSDWSDAAPRFGTVESTLPRLTVTPPPWPRR
jgi:quercetin 2,3-dioxygenase